VKWEPLVQQDLLEQQQIQVLLERLEQQDLLVPLGLLVMLQIQGQPAPLAK
jgi:hypothetical protein